MIEIQALHHVAVCVTDVERAKHFYGVVLGMIEVPRPPFPFGGAWYEFAEGRQVHLIAHPPTLTLRGTTRIDDRDGHLALRVRSYRSTFEHLKAHGVDVLEKPTNLTPWAQLYVTDPDGNVIELNAEALE